MSMKWPHVMACVLPVVGLVAAARGPQPPDGKQLYAANCAACHQLDGRGIPGAFPALAGSRVVQGEATQVAGLSNPGLLIEIEVTAAKK